MEKTEALIDSGVSANFINSSYVNKHKIPRIELAKPRLVQAIDGKNLDKKIHHRVKIDFWIQGKKCTEKFYVMPLGEPNIILGMPWLKRNEPEINWKDGTISLPNILRGFLGMEEEADPLEEAKRIVPPKYHEFLNIFGEEFFTTLPPHRPYDCEIPLMDNAPLP